MAARAKKLSESEQLRFWLDGEIEAAGLTVKDLDDWRPPAAVEAAQKKTRAPSQRRKNAPPAETVVANDGVTGDWEPHTHGAKRRCARLSKDRCWCCTPSDGEELCVFCNADAWNEHNAEIVSWHHAREERAREAAQPYHVALHGLFSSFRGSEMLRTLDELLEEYGTPEAAIAWIRSHSIYFEDFKDLIPHLMAWNLPDGEVSSHGGVLACCRGEAVTWRITRDSVCGCGLRHVDLVDDAGGGAYAHVSDDGVVECVLAPGDRHAEIEAWLANELGAGEVKP